MVTDIDIEIKFNGDGSFTFYRKLSIYDAEKGVTIDDLNLTAMKYEFDSTDKKITLFKILNVISSVQIKEYSLLTIEINNKKLVDFSGINAIIDI